MNCEVLLMAATTLGSKVIGLTLPPGYLLLDPVIGQ